MIDFELSQEQRQLKDLAHRFAVDVIRPAAAAADESEEVPWTVLEQAHAPGLTSYAIPGAYGGGGVESLLTRLLVDEEIFWGCAGVCTILGGIGLVATPIVLAGSEEQKGRFLPRFCQPGKDLTKQAFGFTRRLPNGKQCFVDLDCMLREMRFVAVQAMLYGKSRLFPKCGGQLQFCIRYFAELFDDRWMEFTMVSQHFFKWPS